MRSKNNKRLNNKRTSSNHKLFISPYRKSLKLMIAVREVNILRRVLILNSNKKQQMKKSRLRKVFLNKS